MGCWCVACSSPTPARRTMHLFVFLDSNDCATFHGIVCQYDLASAKRWSTIFWDPILWPKLSLWHLLPVSTVPWLNWDSILSASGANLTVSKVVPLTKGTAIDDPTTTKIKRVREPQHYKKKRKKKVDARTNTAGISNKNTAEQQNSRTRTASHNHQHHPAKTTPGTTTEWQQRANSTHARHRIGGNIL